MYHLLGASVALAVLLGINALASLLAAGLWRCMERPARRWSAAARARVIFVLRTFPAAGAIITVFALLIPSYLTHEPRATTEVVGFKLAIIALLSITGIALALWRGLSAWRATRALAAGWTSHGEPVSLEGISIPSYRIRHAFPVIAVVGTVRPRLFIASQVFDSLTDEELSAALAHEKAHLAAHDNLKRGLLRACRDLLAIVPCGRSLDRAWAEASEAAADERAARAGAQLALNLASTLVKIARIAPVGARATMPAGAFLIDETIGGVAGRVYRLAEMARIDGARGRSGAVDLSLGLWAGLAALFAAVVAAATDNDALATTHALIEHIVHALG